ncbi:MAG: GAF domain-containing protein, partial [Candidatus Margulisbacteria bacterium]|nr:GAF domain-containing protein [Candidatus Margulisiibacteriota bacterium]
MLHQNYYLYTPILIIAIFLGIYILYKNPKSRINKCLCGFILAQALWIFTLLLTDTTGSYNTALFWAKMALIGPSFIPAFFLCFAIVFPDNNAQTNLKKLLLLFTPAILFTVLSPTSLNIKSITIHSWGTEVDPGILYYFLLAYFLGYLGFAFYILFRNQKTAKGHIKQQIKYIFMGAFIGIILGVTTNLILVLLGTSQFSILGPFSALIFSSFIVYAILRHQLMDIEVVIKKTAVYSILTASITGFFIGLIYLGDLMVGHMTGFQSLWMVLIGAIALSLIIQPLRDRVQNIIDKIFFISRYDYQKILKNYSQALSRPTDNLDRYAKLVPYLVCKAIKLKGASFWILNRMENVYEIRDAIKGDRVKIGASVHVENPIIEELIKTKSAISIDDTRNKAVKNEMNSIKSDLCLPCISSSQYFKVPTLIAVLSLGQKMSGEEFTDEDISFLQILANQATISIEYAFIMDELKRNQDMLIQQEKLATLGTTAASIAHELKNPLSYLSTLAQLLPMSWDNKQFRESTEKFMPAEVDRMRIIIDGILDYSRNKELVIEDTDLSKILLKVLTIVAADIRKRKAEITKEIPDQIMIKGDHNRLAQVFMNLINNACESMENAPKKELYIKVKKDGEFVYINIKDTGCGIPPDRLKNIFDPFYTTKKTGTGL